MQLISRLQREPDFQSERVRVCVDLTYFVFLQASRVLFFPEQLLFPFALTHGA